MIHGLETEQGDLPEGVTPLEAVALIKALSPSGEVELWVRTTPGLNAWERLGMLETVAYSTRRELHKGRDEEED